MAPDPTTTRPLGDPDTFEGQETPSYEHIACLLREGSEWVFSLSNDDMVPNMLDILCGRDKVAYGHFGNKSYRETIAIHRNRYQNARSRDEKTRITDEIIALIQECGGRFLRKDKNTNMWNKVSNKYAHEKVSHALRSAKDPQRKCQRRKTKVKNQHLTAEENDALERIAKVQHRILSLYLQE